MAKLRRGPRFLRGIWLLFVLTMTTLLLVSSALLVKDFLYYDVSVYNHIRMDDKSPFPAISVCHQLPFSTNSHKLWANKTILSPAEFNLYMRNQTHDALLKNDYYWAELLWNYDSITIYYQSLQYKHTVALGNPPAIFLNCMRLHHNAQSFEDNCTMLPGYRMRRLSHHMYLNCYTFEPVDAEASTSTSFLSLIVSLVSKDIGFPKQHAFLSDLFEQARGLRVVVHEAGTLPDFEKNGIHVEPGKLNEIIYEPFRWKKLNTPRRPCIHANQSLQFNDLEERYNYTHNHCLLVHQQTEIIDKCKCVFAYNPRPFIPNDTIPYCGQLWPSVNKSEVMNRMTCLHHYTANEVKHQYDGTKCFPRCEYYEYSSTTSITKWRAELWQLYWLRVQNQASQNLKQFHELYPNKSLNESSAFHLWKTYLVRDNLSVIPQLDKPVSSGKSIWPLDKLDLDGDDFAYVVLRRRAGHTLEKTEKLVLSLYVLLSRIGGLCSLTVGLTAAFIVELVEFIYLLCQSSSETSSEKKKVDRGVGVTTEHCTTCHLNPYDSYDVSNQHATFGQSSTDNADTIILGNSPNSPWEPNPDFKKSSLYLKPEAISVTKEINGTQGDDTHLIPIEKSTTRLTGLQEKSESLVSRQI